MRLTVAGGLRLLTEHGGRRWVAVAALAALVSLMEVLAALLILLTLAGLTGAEAPTDVPILRDLAAAASPPSTPFLVTVALFFVAKSALTVAATHVQQVYAHDAGVEVSRRLLRGYLTADLADHVRDDSARMTRNALESANSLVAYVFAPVVSVIAESTVLVALAAVLAVTDPVPFLLAAVALGPLSLAVQRFVRPRLVAAGEAVQHGFRVSLATLREGIDGFRDVRVLGKERYVVEVFHTQRRQMAAAQAVRETWSALPRATLDTLVILLLLSLVGLTVLTDRSTDDLLVTLGIFGYAGLRLLPALNRVLAGLNALRFGASAAELVAADLEAAAHRPLPEEDGVEPLELRKGLELQGVTFRYAPDAPPVLREVDLIVRPGSYVGIAGATGSGKSTLLDVVLGLLEPEEGEVLLDGRPLRDVVRRWHRSIGLVSQHSSLANATLRENIAFGVDPARIDDALVARAIELAQLRDVVDALPDGLETMVGEQGVRLSGGQRQRLALARALYREPSVLVLDEATSALDNETEAALLSALGRLEGRTILAIAHRVTTLRSCDLILVLDGGRVVDRGSFDELASRSPLFRRDGAER